MEKKENKYLKQAMEELGYLSEEPGFQRLIEARVGFLKDEHAFEVEGMKRGMKRGMEKGIKEGIKQGKKEGKTEAQIEIAKKLLKENYTVEKIAEITNLTKKEIETIKKDL